jgi:hypothetical protein
MPLYLIQYSGESEHVVGDNYNHAIEKWKYKIATDSGEYDPNDPEDFAMMYEPHSVSVVCSDEDLIL